MDKEATMIEEKQIIIDKSDLDFIHKQYKDKIADLEAKLAESKRKYEDRKKFCIIETRSLTEIINNLLEENNQLKQQLADTKKAFNTISAKYEKKSEQIFEIIKRREECSDAYDFLSKENDQLKQQLEEKEKEETKRMEDFEKRCQEYYNSDEYKRDFAIAELEKARKCFGDYLRGLFWNDTMLVGKVCNMVNKIIDQQIKELKGEM